MPVAPSQMAAPDTARKVPIRLLETDLFKHAELEGLVKDLFERYENEGSVSRGTRNIAPTLFIGSERKGYFNYCRSNHIVLVYAYTGPEDYFREIAEEMYLSIKLLTSCMNSTSSTTKEIFSSRASAARKTAPSIFAARVVAAKRTTSSTSS